MNKRFLKITVLITSMAILFSSCSKDDDSELTVQDIDGNVYKTVTIGTQIWMAENLRTTKYNDGTDIPIVTDDEEWRNLTTGAYCHYNNTTNADTIATYGRLYNFFAVYTGKLAPKGWHVPTEAERVTLITYLGGESVAGGKLKETGTNHWNSPNTGATNETGFTALPGGERGDWGNFSDIGSLGCWWSATTDYYNPWDWELSFNGSNVYWQDRSARSGLSVRCVKD